MTDGSGWDFWRAISETAERLRSTEHAGIRRRVRADGDRRSLERWLNVPDHPTNDMLGYDPVNLQVAEAGYDGRHLVGFFADRPENLDSDQFITCFGEDVVELDRHL